jgi:hypothetical protein
MNRKFQSIQQYRQNVNLFHGTMPIPSPFVLLKPIKKNILYERLLYLKLKQPVCEEMSFRTVNKKMSKGKAETLLGFYIDTGPTESAAEGKLRKQQ